MNQDQEEFKFLVKKLIELNELAKFWQKDNKKDLYDSLLTQFPSIIPENVITAARKFNTPRKRPDQFYDPFLRLLGTDTWKLAETVSLPDISVLLDIQKASDILTENRSNFIYSHMITERPPILISETQAKEFMEVKGLVQQFGRLYAESYEKHGLEISHQRIVRMQNEVLFNNFGYDELCCIADLRDM
ncbi:MAG: hypothetical protein KAQ83_03990, partial [Nanoarchaeota archaeon]|nr:hypothetical protein [Nanoarchaeota archaeon]